MLNRSERTRGFLAIWLMALALCGPAVVDAGAQEASAAAPASSTAMALDPRTPATLYAGTSAGRIWRSTDGGARWQQVGVLPGGATVQHLIVDPALSTDLYAASGPNIYKSTDSGASWSPATTGLTQEPPGYNYISALAASPVAPATLWAGMRNSGGGVTFTSTDRAAHWAPSGGLAFGFAFDPNAPDTVYAAGWDIGVFKTTDGGAHWSLIKSLVFNSVVLVDPQTPTTVYAADAAGAVLKSTDGGANWTAADSGLDTGGPGVGCLVIDPQAPQTLYAAVGPGIYRTTNGGVRWTQVNGEMRGASALMADPGTAGVLYALRGGSIYKSTDGGANWGLTAGVTGALVSQLHLPIIRQ